MAPSRTSSGASRTANGLKSAATGRSQAAAHLFVVIDDSVASRRAVSYLARFFTPSRCQGVSFCLAYIMPAPPAKLLEFGGAEDPLTEERLTTGLRGRQSEWTASAERGPAQRLTQARAVLRRAGVKQANVETYLSSPLDQRGPVEEALLLARERHCDTIVIGHRSHSWFGSGRDSLAEHLIRDGSGFAIWVID